MEEKNKEREWGHTSFYFSKPFGEIWKKFLELVKTDNDKEFINYCREIEGVDYYNLKDERKKSIYIRWILTTHFLKKQNLLRK